MGTFSDTDRTVLRIPRSTPGEVRTAEDLLRAEIHAWASWKHDPARFETDMLAVYGLTPLDEPADEDRPAPEPEPDPEPEADPIEHGTTRGARKHRERDEDLCDHCWGAVRAADRRYKATAREYKPVTQ